MESLLSTILEFSPPTHFAYLGAHPILCAYFQTQDPLHISNHLKQLSNKECNQLLDALKALPKHPKYPHSNTVWQFNDLDAELGMFVSFLQIPTSPTDVSNKFLALDAILSLLELHRVTYPFIDISFTENALDFFCETEQSEVLAELPMRPNPSSPQTHQFPIRPKPNGLATLMIPSIALGSLFFAHSLTKDI